VSNSLQALLLDLIDFFQNFICLVKLPSKASFERSLIFFLFIPFCLSAEKLNLSVSAESAILINADTGAILYEKKPHDPHYPASITKVPTALYALQKAQDQLDTICVADQECIGTVTEAVLRRSNYTLPAYLLIPDGSHIGVKKGEELSFRDLLYGMMLASGDDAANIIAKQISGSIPQFMEEMNAYIKALGANNTTLMNPHGLHHPNQTTTAYDMAIIAKEALKNKTFCEIVSTVRYMRPKTNKQAAYMMIQTNKLLRKGPCYYPKAIGVKTGYYSLAGSTVVAAARDKDRTLIAVLLKSRDRKEMFLDAKKMFEIAFSQPKVQKELLAKGKQTFTLAIPDAEKPLTTYTEEPLIIQYYPAEEPKVKCAMHWAEGLKLPIVKGQKVGSVILYRDGEKYLSPIPIYAEEAVNERSYFKVKQLFRNKWVGGALFMAFFAVFALQLRRK